MVTFFFVSMRSQGRRTGKFSIRSLIDNDNSNNYNSKDINHQSSIINFIFPTSSHLSQFFKSGWFDRKTGWQIFRWIQVLFVQCQSCRWIGVHSQHVGWRLVQTNIANKVVQREDPLVNHSWFCLVFSRVGVYLSRCSASSQICRHWSLW